MSLNIVAAVFKTSRSVSRSVKLLAKDLYLQKEYVRHREPAQQLEKTYVKCY